MLSFCNFLQSVCWSFDFCFVCVHYSMSKRGVYTDNLCSYPRDYFRFHFLETHWLPGGHRFRETSRRPQPVPRPVALPGCTGCLGLHCAYVSSHFIVSLFWVWSCKLPVWVALLLVFRALSWWLLPWVILPVQLLWGFESVGRSLYLFSVWRWEVVACPDYPLVRWHCATLFSVTLFNLSDRNRTYSWLNRLCQCWL